MSADILKGEQNYAYSLQPQEIICIDEDAESLPTTNVQDDPDVQIIDNLKTNNGKQTTQRLLLKITDISTKHLEHVNFILVTIFR